MRSRVPVELYYASNGICQYDWKSYCHFEPKIYVNFGDRHRAPFPKKPKHGNIKIDIQIDEMLCSGFS